MTTNPADLVKPPVVVPRERHLRRFQARMAVQREQEGLVRVDALAVRVPVLVHIAAEYVAARALDDGQRGALTVALAVELTSD